MSEELRKAMEAIVAGEPEIEDRASNLIMKARDMRDALSRINRALP